ncbi:YhgE/Pip family protein [Herbiconiux moechotypicola]|uniref:YhgE/Pip domain-containing protein n=1 Tax=Herbiconiux moechotypicola TaxID=637393 RepID=A0ABN3DAM6_9MICO|nr:YhgE/Pip family protein [Herbiconiux moechotypicola]MCS5728947.1 YhgE/Pip family protein [Herbiconiux moechotypicola]
MTSLRSLVSRGDGGVLSPTARRVAIVLAVLTPLVVAGVAVTAVRGTDAAAAGSTGPSDSASTTPVTSPELPAAVVNGDQLVYVGDDGTVTPAASDGSGTGTPVLAGKLLVSELTSGDSGEGFTWTVTDADTASSGLASGEFAAVVTIPEDFSASYASLGGDSPVQAQLQVETNGAGSYVTGLLASALSTNLQEALSDQATKQFVTGLLAGFTTLNSQLGEAATGAGQLAAGASELAGYTGELASGLATAAGGAAELNGATQELAVGMRAIADGTADLPGYADLIAAGSDGVTTGIGVLTARLAEETAASAAIDARQHQLESDIAALSAQVPDLSPAEIQAQLAGLQSQAASIRDASFAVTAGLGLDALGVTALQGFSAEVSSGATQFATDLPLLTTTLSDVAGGTEQLATGTSGLASGLGELSTAATGLAGGSTELATNMGALASGLDEAVAAIPSYTEAQQDSISTVVTEPVVTDQSDLGAPPTTAGAIAAVAVPLALWIGAFAIYLLLVPFGRRELASTASTFRVVVSSLVPAAVLALVQAAVIAVALFVVGAHPAHAVGSILFAFVMAISFVMLHQGLVALFGLAGRLVSLAFVVVQVAAAAVILPSGLSAPFYTGLADVLPLSHAVTGMQALISGGSLAVAVQSSVVLLVFAAIGLVLTLVAATRARSRSTVLVARPA